MRQHPTEYSAGSIRVLLLHVCVCASLPCQVFQCLRESSVFRRVSSSSVARSARVGPVSLVLRGRTDSKSVSSETVQLSSGSSLICGRRHGKHTRALSHVCCRAHRMRAHADSLEGAVGGGMRGLHGREARVAQRTRQRILAQAADRDRVETADAAAEIEHSTRILLFPCDKEWADGVEREGRLHVACLRQMRREHVEAIQAVRLVRTQRHVRNRRSPSGLVRRRSKKKPLYF